LNGAGADIVNEAEAGFVVPAENSLALVEAIRCLYLMSENKKSVMGANGRRFYEKNFSRDKLIQDLIEHISLAVKKYQKEIQ
jgi:glycosyltransferase involved in cell wall biosynthesis